MVYRQAQNNPETRLESKLAPWYKRWFTRPFVKLTVLSTDDPVCIQDAWGRIWFQNRENVWVSENYPYFINDLKSANEFRSAIIAYTGSLGKKTFVKKA